MLNLHGRHAFLWFHFSGFFQGRFEHYFGRVIVEYFILLLAYISESSNLYKLKPLS